MVYKFVNKKSSGGGTKRVDASKSNLQLTDKLHRPIIRMFQKHKVNSPFIDNMESADLADMQLMRRFYPKEIYFYRMF